MRTLKAARIVVLDADSARRDDLCRALAELGIFGIVGIATVADAGNGAAPADLYIVEGPSLAANDDGDGISPNPFAASGIATILLLPDATNTQRRKALNAGYSIVIGLPVSPRLLYRRIGHVMQIARRAKQRGAIALAVNARIEPVAHEEPALAVSIPVA